jgi:Mg2+-importing ATPase
MPRTPLDDGFSRFLRRHGMARHFSSPVAPRRAEPPQHPPAPRALADQLSQASAADVPSLLRSLGSHPDGLSAEKAQILREEFGPNEAGHDQPPPGWLHLWHCYANPFNLLLTALVAVSALTRDTQAALVIFAMVALSTALRFVQEGRSNRAADQLRAWVSSKATVMRRDLAAEAADEARQFFGVQLHPGAPHREEIPIRDLVPGDVVVLAAGDMIAADMRLLAAKDLFLNQAAMTGESLPVEKFAVHTGSAKPPVELSNIVLMGTHVVSGSGLAVVLTTGRNTLLGAMTHGLTAQTPGPTAFQAGINRVSWLLIRFMLVMVPLVLLINGFTKGDWLEAFLFSLSIAVGLTPEMLPMIVTSTLAKGAVALSRKRVVVKRLDAIQNLGAMNVLCTDKTGTLTQDKIFLERHTDARGQASDEVLRLAFLNSHFQTGLKNLLDVAVLEHAEVHQALAPATNYVKVDEIPFDFQRRRMSVVVSERGAHHALICKGALEEVLSVCTQVRLADGRDAPLNTEHLAQVRATTTDLNEQGLRVVAVAVKKEPPAKHVYGVADEAGLTLVGYVAFLDPPKDSTAPALAALKAHGVEVKILTGDNERVTAKICREVGLAQRGMLLGTQIDTLSDAELSRALADFNVFAKLNPAQKERLVRVLRSGGHVVGFLGDGINDAPALRAADVGISVDSAVDIAKEAADIILLEKSLLVLDEGVIEGRRTFANMLKYIRMTASSNFGNVFSVLMASAFLPFLPMLPLQLLVQNLLYDISQTAIPFDHVDDETLACPQRWKPDDIGRFMLWFGPVSSVFDLITFAVLGGIFHAHTPATQGVFQAGWFIEGLLSQTLVVHLIRTRKLPLLQSRAAWPLMAMTLLVMATGLALVAGPWAAMMGFKTPPAAFFACLLAILLAYAGTVQALKPLYAKHHGWL